MNKLRIILNSFLRKYKFILILFIESLLVLFHSYKYNINYLELIRLSGLNIINGKLIYNQSGLGVMDLTSSLVCLSLIIAVYTFVHRYYSDSITKNGYKNECTPYYISWLWMIPIISFIFSVSLSIIKLSIAGIEKIELIEGLIDQVGYLSFSYFLFGVITLVIWFVISILKINEEMEKGY